MKTSMIMEKGIGKSWEKIMDIVMVIKLLDLGFNNDCKEVKNNNGTNCIEGADNFL